MGILLSVLLTNLHVSPILNLPFQLITFPCRQNRFYVRILLKTLWLLLLQGMRGKMNTNCLWHACKALFIGLLLFAIGAIMSTLGKCILIASWPVSSLPETRSFRFHKCSRHILKPSPYRLMSDYVILPMFQNLQHFQRFWRRFWIRTFGFSRKVLAVHQSVCCLKKLESPNQNPISTKQILKSSCFLKQALPCTQALTSYVVIPFATCLKSAKSFPCNVHRREIQKLL